MINLILDALLHIYLNALVWQNVSFDSGLQNIDVKALKVYVDARTEEITTRKR